MGVRIRWVLAFLVKLLLLPVAIVAGFLLATVVSRHPQVLSSPIELPSEPIPPRRADAIEPIVGSGSLQGIVVSAEAPAGSPGLAAAVVRATVGLRNLEAVANEFGRFQFSELPEGPITLTAKAEGFRPALVGPVESSAKEITIKLSPIRRLKTEGDSIAPPAPGELTVLVLSEDPLRPPPRVTVVALPTQLQGPGPLGIPRTAAIEDPRDARVSFTALPPGRYRVFAVPLGGSPDPRLAYAETTVDVVTGPPAVAPVELKLRWGSVTGVVTADGKPVARAFVQVLKRTGEPPKGRGVEPSEVVVQRGLTDADGRFSIPEVPFGATTVEVLVAGRRPWSSNVVLTSESGAITVVLEPSK